MTQWVGVTMMLGGLAMLGWVAWQFWGTNYVSQNHQASVTKELRAQWTEQGTRLQRLKPAYVPKGKASALIRVPRFGKNYVVPVLEGVSTDVLAKGFGHFPSTADPGQVGNFALAAHRVTHGEPLKGMPKLRPGDTVFVETVEASYVYRVDTAPTGW